MQTTLLFYNVENLFDTLDDPLTHDNAYLPNSSLRWMEKRYVLKLQRIARVLQDVEDPFPGVVGLAEVENRKVLRDLLSVCGLTEQEVGIIHTNSPDERGMDVALLYRKDLFSEVEGVSPEIIPVHFADDPLDKTRDMLKVPLQTRDNFLLFFFVAHWPSRKEGIAISRSKRFAASQALRSRIDLTIRDYPDAGILVMGDLNCTPDSPPVYRILDQKGHPDNPLQNLSWDIHHRMDGSTTYRGKWLMFDQMLANSSLQKDTFSPYYVSPLRVIKRDWMLYLHPKYKDYRPNKTYGGRKYHAGFSDHLPVALDLFSR